MQPDLTALYPVPSELVSEEQADKLHGRDLPSLPDDDLKRELSFLRVLNFVTASNWHLEREVRVAAELSRRRDIRRFGRRT